MCSCIENTGEGWGEQMDRQRLFSTLVINSLSYSLFQYEAGRRLVPGLYGKTSTEKKHVCEVSEMCFYEFFLNMLIIAVQRGQLICFS